MPVRPKKKNQRRRTMKMKIESPRGSNAVIAGRNLRDRHLVTEKRGQKKAWAPDGPRMTREEVRRIVMEVLG
jgi:hypothetical protein